MSFKATIKLFFAVTVLLLEIFHGYSLAYQVTESFQPTGDESKKGEKSCFRCNKELDEIRSNYHLQMIKERIQTLLAIDSDSPQPDNSTKMLSHMMGRIKEVFREKSEGPSPAKTERQILLPENGKFHVSLLTDS